MLKQKQSCKERKMVFTNNIKRFNQITGMKTKYEYYLMNVLNIVIVIAIRLY